MKLLQIVFLFPAGPHSPRGYRGRTWQRHRRRRASSFRQRFSVSTEASSGTARCGRKGSALVYLWFCISCFGNSDAKMVERRDNTDWDIVGQEACWVRTAARMQEFSLGPADLKAEVSGLRLEGAESPRDGWASRWTLNGRYCQRFHGNSSIRQDCVTVYLWDSLMTFEHTWEVTLGKHILVDLEYAPLFTYNDCFIIITIQNSNLFLIAHCFMKDTDS